MGAGRLAIVNRPFFGAAISIIALLLLATIAFSGGLHGPLFLDDSTNLDITTVESGSVAAVWEAAAANSSGPIGRPLSVLSFVLNNLLSGPDPYRFKYTNLALHLINGLLAYWLLLLLIPKVFSEWSEERVVISATVPVLLWIIHPIHTSAVLYTVQRMAILQATFVFVALILFMKARFGAWQLGWQKLVLYCGVMLAVGLAVLAKENGILALAYILLLDFILANTPIRQSRERQLIWMIVGALPLVVGGGYFIANIGTLLAGYVDREFTLVERGFTQVGVLFSYIKLIVLPAIADFSIYNDDYPLATNLNLMVALKFFGHLMLIGGAIYLRRINKLIPLGVLLFYLSHLIESTILPLEIYFEHRNYIGALGLMIAIAALIQTIKIDKQRYQLAPLVYVPLLLFISINVSDLWDDDLLYNYSAVLDRPNSTRASVELANSYFERGMLDRGRSVLAQAVERSPRQPGLRLQLSTLFCEQPELFDRHYRAGLELIPEASLKAYTIYNLFNYFRNINTGRCPALSGEKFLALAAAIYDKPTEFYRYQRVVYLSRAYLMLGRFGDAERVLQFVIEQAPTVPRRFRYEPLLELIDSAAAVGDLATARRYLEFLLERQDQLSVRNLARLLAVRNYSLPASESAAGE